MTRLQRLRLLAAAIDAELEGLPAGNTQRRDRLIDLRRQVRAEVAALERREAHRRREAPTRPSDGEVRDWARAAGLPVNPRGYVKSTLRAAWNLAHPSNRESDAS